MPAPAVSILLPVHNAAPWLDECLHSIRAQTFENWELIAIDDHSDDGSSELLRRFAADEPRIRLLDNPGRGLVEALNFGLGRCRADLVARMDGDDRMHPDRLQQQHDYLQQRPDIDVLGTQVRLFPEDIIQAGFREYIRWQNLCLTPDDFVQQLYIESPLTHPSVMFRREAIVTAGGYRADELPEDYELWLRLHAAGHRFAKLDRILLDWRERPDRVSRTDPRCARAAFDRVRADYLARDPRLLARRDDFVIWGAGRKTRLRCRLLLQQGFAPQAWIDIDPRKIGNRLDGVPVVSPDWLQRDARPFVLVYVTNHGARELIAQDLAQFGYRVGVDYLMVG